MNLNFSAIVLLLMHSSIVPGCLDQRPSNCGFSQTSDPGSFTKVSFSFLLSLTFRPKKLSFRLMRHTAYRSFVFWIFGYLGAKNRVEIPACVVNKIREVSPFFPLMILLRQILTIPIFRRFTNPAKYLPVFKMSQKLWPCWIEIYWVGSLIICSCFRILMFFCTPAVNHIYIDFFHLVYEITQVFFFFVH